MAEQGSQLLGLVGLIAKGNEAEIEPIIVGKTQRGKGIGSRLLQTAIAEAQRKEIRLLTVKSVARNKGAIEFYHKHGFKNVGFIELFMDLSKRSWKSKIEIFGCEFDF